MTLQQHIEKLIEKHEETKPRLHGFEKRLLLDFASELSKDHVLVPREPTDEVVAFLSKKYPYPNLLGIGRKVSVDVYGQVLEIIKATNTEEDKGNE